MNIAVIGAGYVGLPFAAVLADLGHKVWIIRRDKEKNEALKKGKIHFFEPGLEKLVKKNLKAGRFIPTTDYSEAIPEADVVFIAVGTPSSFNGAADLSQVFAAAKEIGKNLKKSYTVVVDKSTVPPGTAVKVKEIIEKDKKPGAKFDVCSCPEFLREGFAIEDAYRPDRVIIGSESPRATRILKQLHQDFKAPILVTNTISAETVKYAANAYLALRIVFANQIADFCEKAGADVEEIIKGIGLDKRIGSHYWYPGLGYGGSCFPKDVTALAAFGRKLGEEDSLFEKMDKFNRARVAKIIVRLEKKFGSFNGKTIGIFGLACKKGTDDVRNSPAVDFIQVLKKKKAKLKAYDPLALEKAKEILTGIIFCSDPYQAVEKDDILMILNDCPDFAKLDYAKIKKLMRGRFIFDSRNILNKEKTQSLGFSYQGTGR